MAVVAEGDRAACEALLAALRGGRAPGAVRQVVEQWTDATGDLRGFVESVSVAGTVGGRSVPARQPRIAEWQAGRGARVHLKSLTLKGFKSFASATTLRLEPGITCVVGPNGSGKSNVVDAISWVLGEQGAKALRGGKMEDVIFAGTSGRAPLGRAEVTLTIDNSDGALPIDYAEVSITRRMFRDGAGEYEINGTSCRLLDIQELLSRLRHRPRDARHRRAGPARLGAAVASPEDRRAYIEEAAGVLKHRKRKEKALRKLDAMQANLTRLTDLTAELRRQLKPLGRQAEIARRAQAVQSELRDARLRLAADDLVTAARRAGPGGGRRGGAPGPAAPRSRSSSPSARVEQQRLEAALAAGRAAAGRGTGHLVPALRAGRAAARHRRGWPRSGRGTSPTPAERARRRAATRTSWRPRPRRSPSRRRSWSRRSWRRPAARSRRSRRRGPSTSATLAAAERAHLAAVRALADRRAGLATLAGRAEALRSGAAATAEEIERLSDALGEAQARTAARATELEGAREATRGRSPRATTASSERSPRRRDGARGRARRGSRELVARERAAEQQRAHWRARVEALSVGLARRDGSGALLGDGGPDGVLGAVSALVTVEPEARTAVAARSGELADAVAVAVLGRRGRRPAPAARRRRRTGLAGRRGR